MRPDDYNLKLLPPSFSPWQPTKRSDRRIAVLITGTEPGSGESLSLTYDINGNMITRTIDGLTTQLYYNWDNKLRSAAVTDADTVDIVYDPDDNRASRTVTDSDDRTTKRKYIVDITGPLPVILAEIDTNTGSLKRSYIYAGPQPIAFCNGDWRAAGARYYYLHDRLGSVRQIINSTADVVNNYTFNPHGEDLTGEVSQTVGNSFKFTGQYHDVEFGQYYLRARQYDPHIARFTARDPVFGEFEAPMLLHVYLYCLNNPINRFDLSGMTSGDLWVKWEPYPGTFEWKLNPERDPGDGGEIEITTGDLLQTLRIFKDEKLDTTIDPRNLFGKGGDTLIKDVLEINQITLRYGSREFSAEEVNYIGVGAGFNRFNLGIAMCAYAPVLWNSAMDLGEAWDGRWGGVKSWVRNRPYMGAKKGEVLFAYLGYVLYEIVWIEDLFD